MEYSTTGTGGIGALQRGLRDAAALVLTGGVYWLRLQPISQRELARWRRRGCAIPDPLLRRLALGKLTEEALNPEAAALFAVLAPRGEQRRIVAFIVAFQVLYDYLDALNETPGCSDLRSGLRINRALPAALDSTAPSQQVLDAGCDGGYVDALIAECRRTLGEVTPQVSEILTAAAARCGEAQSHNHAYVAGGEESVIAWSNAQIGPDGSYAWWELAAGGISCLAVHALVACSAHPAPRPAELEQVQRAYFPSICALSALLDSLADLDDDAATENHSFVSHYRDDEQMGARLVAIASEASTLLAPLSRAARHRVILAGICAYYLSLATGGPAAVARDSLLGQLGWLGKPMLAVMHARRHLHEGRTRRPDAVSPAPLERASGARRRRSRPARQARAAWLRRSRQPAQAARRSPA